MVCDWTVYIDFNHLFYPRMQQWLCCWWHSLWNPIQQRILIVVLQTHISGIFNCCRFDTKLSSDKSKERYYIDKMEKMDVRAVFIQQKQNIPCLLHCSSTCIPCEWRQTSCQPTPTTCTSISAPVSWQSLRFGWTVNCVQWGWAFGFPSF